MANLTCKYCNIIEVDKETEFCSSRCQELWHKKSSKLCLEQDNLEQDGSSAQDKPSAPAAGKFDESHFLIKPKHVSKSLIWKLVRVIKYEKPKKKFHVSSQGQTCD